MYKCPYEECGFTGTDEEVDEHRSLAGIHEDRQAGANIKVAG